MLGMNYVLAKVLVQAVATRVSTLPKKVQISVQNPVQAQIQFVQYISGTVKLTISKKQFFYLMLVW